MWTTPSPVPYAAANSPALGNGWTSATTMASDGRACLAICVYCGAANDVPHAYRAVAAQLGDHIARRGHRLVYGGGTVGLMHEVASAAQRAGDTVVGVMPCGLFDQELLDGPIGELVATDTLRERKAEMDRRADAFVVLPGGLGTLDELIEVVTLRQLGVHRRPVVVVNVDGYWDPLLAMLTRMAVLGFAPTSQGALLDVVETPAQAIQRAEQLVDQPSQAPLTPPQGLGDA